MWATSGLLIIVSLLLAIWGASHFSRHHLTPLLFSEYESQKNKAFGVVLLITSLVVFLFGNAKLTLGLENTIYEFPSSVVNASAVVSWVAAFYFGRSRLSTWLIKGPIQVAILMSSVFWWIVQDSIYSVTDVFLYLALTFWVSVRTVR